MVDGLLCFVVRRDALYKLLSAERKATLAYTLNLMLMMSSS